MNNMPRRARIYYWTVLVLGAVTTIWSVLSYSRPSPNAGIGLFCLLLLALVAGSRKVQIIRSRKLDETGSMSLGFVVYFSTLLLYGPNCGMLAALLSCLSSCLYPKRQPNYQLVFNVALTVLEAWYAGWTFFLINHHSLKIVPYSTMPAAAVATVTYFCINTVGIALIIGLCSETHPFELWRTKFVWTAPSFFAGAAISTFAILLFHDQFIVHLVLGAPIAYLTYHSYAVYIERNEEKQQHINQLQCSQEHLSELYLATVKSLALAIAAKDQYTHQHILRVQSYALAIAERLGLKESDLEAVRTGALLHDIGKLGVSEHILLKPGRLTEEEFAKIKKHPEIGAAILDPVDFPWPVVSAVKYHHERWNGTGYPEGLCGEQIPLIARILAVADVYDALASERPYRNAWTHTDAIQHIRDHSGLHYDPVVVDTFLCVIDAIRLQDAATDNSDGMESGNAPQSTFTHAIIHPEVIRKADLATQDIQHASSELWALYEVAQSTANCFGLQDTLNILGDKLQTILPGTTCLFLLHNKETDSLQVRTARGINHTSFAGGSARDGNSLSMGVMQTRQRYIGAYDANDLLLNESTGENWIPLQSALIVPIVHQGETLGTINLYHPTANAFTPYYCQLLDTIAERAAMALYNGHLFDRTRSHAITDPLTGLYNVRFLAQHVEYWCEAHASSPQTGMGNGFLREGQERGELVSLTGEMDYEPASPANRFALLCLDLDYFKPINDNFGHQNGDRVLRELSALFKSLVRQEDILARYGGDEFLIAMKGASHIEADELAARLQEAVERYDPGLIHHELGAIRLGVSIGYACYPDDCRDYASLLANSDTHMYRNKTERKLRRLAQIVPATPSLTDKYHSAITVQQVRDNIGPGIDYGVSLVQSHPTIESAANQDEKEPRYA